MHQWTPSVHLTNNKWEQQQLEDKCGGNSDVFTLERNAQAHWDDHLSISFVLVTAKDVKGSVGRMRRMDSEKLGRGRTRHATFEAEMASTAHFSALAGPGMDRAMSEGPQ